MNVQLHTSQKQSILIAEQALGIGGEGQVFAILSPASLQNYVVKIYHPKERTRDKHLKVNYLKANRPNLKDDFSIIWVEDLVYENGKFVGFLMRKAVSSIDLTYLCSLQISEKLAPEWHQKYNRNTIEGLLNRSKICYNIATALNQIHQNGKYVLVDIKPENIKIQSNGHISLLDIDSIEVADNQKIMFPAKKLTLEYSPAERTKLNFQSDYIPENWDYFSMAVVFYKVIFGLHPFAATGKGELAQLVSHEQKIEAGLFANGNKKADLQVIPKPHTNFNALPYDLKELFIRAFDEGFQNPEKRPSAQEWCEVLQNVQFIKKNYQSPVPKVVKPKPTAKTTNAVSHSKSISYKKSIPWIVLMTVLLFFLALDFLKNQTNLSSHWREKKKESEVYDAGKSKSERCSCGRCDEEPITNKDKKTFKTLIKVKESLIEDYKEISKLKGLRDYSIIQANNKYYLYYEEEKVKHKIVYDYIGKQNNDLQVFVKDGKSGMLAYGFEVIPNIYELLDGISEEGLIRAQKDGKYGYVSAIGQVIIPFKFDKASNFEGQKARVMLNGFNFDVDISGDLTIIESDSDKEE